MAGAQAALQAQSADGGAGERSGGSGASSGVSGAPGAGEVSSSGKAGPGPGSALDAMHWRVQKINKHGRLQERNMVVDLRAGTLSNYASDRLRKAFRLTSLWKLDTDLRDPRRLLIHFQPSARQGSYELVMTHADDRDELCKVIQTAVGGGGGGASGLGALASAFRREVLWAGWVAKESRGRMAGSRRERRWAVVARGKMALYRTCTSTAERAAAGRGGDLGALGPNGGGAGVPVNSLTLTPPDVWIDHYSVPRGGPQVGGADGGKAVDGGCDPHGDIGGEKSGRGGGGDGRGSGSDKVTVHCPYRTFALRTPEAAQLAAALCACMMPRREEPRSNVASALAVKRRSVGVGLSSAIGALWNSTVEAVGNSSLANTARHLVSKKKNRFIDAENGFDLDLTYVTPRIVAMGFPSEGVEATYRNKMAEVQRFFATRHKGRFKIYNLCSERVYDPSKFGGACAHYPFNDHNPPPLSLLPEICLDVHDFLAAHEDNVVAIHCKAGKGRTGTVIACVLLHEGLAQGALHALKTYGSVRTSNDKGVTIPSQARYVHYYERQMTAMRIGMDLDVSKRWSLESIVVAPVPNFDRIGGCDPYVRVYAQVWRNGRTLRRRVYDSLDYTDKVRHASKSLDFAEIDLRQRALGGNGNSDKPRGPVVCGDVRLELYDQDERMSDDHMFDLWFHTAFVEALGDDGERGVITFTKPEIDRAAKDKRSRNFAPGFTVTLKLARFAGEAAEGDPWKEYEDAAAANDASASGRTGSSSDAFSPSEGELSGPGAK